ncbi:MAG: hypothetical protein K6G63_04305 [Eubacterium sp.]|nr:hypothetical protein [Eubacterium sp.]
MKKLFKFLIVVVSIVGIVSTGLYILKNILMKDYLDDYDDDLDNDFFVDNSDEMRGYVKINLPDDDDISEDIDEVITD